MQKYDRKIIGAGIYGLYAALYCAKQGAKVLILEKENTVFTRATYVNQGCYHEIIGYNYRLEGIQGAVLCVSLKYLDDWTKRRIEIGNKYLNQINNEHITMQKHPENTEPVFHLFKIMTDGDPEEFIEYMRQKDIECNRHYPVPCHLQKAYSNLGYKPGDCPNAEALASHCVTLPLFPEMTDDEVSTVINAINNYKK